ncbi:MAG: hypothetical protein U5K36_10715 [Roseovarius sp.]|nr:hypothetical protein [Roseovarius sp.]
MSPSTSLGLTKSVMPNCRAISSLAGLRSTPMIMSAPGQPQALDDVEADAAEAEHRPPSAPSSTLAVLMTAPMPVVTPQPI